jgi:hypothetical protein
MGDHRADVISIKRPWFSLPGLGEPPTAADQAAGEAPKWGRRPSLDALRDRMEAARRDAERAEQVAYQAREAAEEHRSTYEVARADLIAALSELGLFDLEPPAKEGGDEH